MSSQVLLSKYIQNAENALAQIRLGQKTKNPSQEQVAEVVDYAKRYLNDAKYYGEKKQYQTGLVSISYCEGMLDALKLLKLVKFTWSEAKEKK